MSPASRWASVPLYVQAIFSSGRHIMTPITATQLRKDKYTGDEDKHFSRIRLAQRVEYVAPEIAEPAVDK